RRLRAAYLVPLTAAPLGLGIAHALALDAPPEQLFTVTAHPAHGIPTLLALAASAGVVAAQLRAIEGRRRLARAAAWLAGLLVGYAASLGTLALFSSFDLGWVAVTALWCAAALALTFTRHARGGLVWLAVATFAVTQEGLGVLAPGARCAAFVLVAA